MSSPPSKNNRRGSRIGETTGECAAVWCCCPCAMMHLVVLAVYRLPIGLWKKKKRNRLLKKKRKQQVWRNGYEEEETTTDGDDSITVENSEKEIVVVDWEKEMLDRFYGAGFWRSGSRKSTDDEELD